MPQILIEKISQNTYKVTVLSNITTEHVVTVRPEYAQQLTQGKQSVEILLQKSFEFLLAREPNTSILRSFDLSVISRYFPEFERTFSQMS